MVSLNDLISPANRLVSWLLRSQFHSLASKGLMLVSWSGRKTGRSFSIPVGYQREEDSVLVLISKPMEKAWWKNFRTPWPAELTIRRKVRTAMGEIVPPGSREFYEACERTLERLPWMGSQFGGIDFDSEVGLDDAQREILARHVGAVRFDFTD